MSTMLLTRSRTHSHTLRTLRQQLSTTTLTHTLTHSHPTPAILSTAGQRLWQPYSFINGEFVTRTDGKTFDVFNPFNGEVLASVPAMSAQVSEGVSE